MESPSTKRCDSLFKGDCYQAAGIASRWLVDPLEVTVTVLELRDGRYEQVALGTGGETVEIPLPWLIAFSVASLQD